MICETAFSSTRLPDFRGCRDVPGVCARERSGVDTPVGFRPVEERLEKEAFSGSRVRSITVSTLADLLGND